MVLYDDVNYCAVLLKFGCMLRIVQNDRGRTRICMENLQSGRLTELVDDLLYDEAQHTFKDLVNKLVTEEEVVYLPDCIHRKRT